MAATTTATAATASGGAAAAAASRGSPPAMVYHPSAMVAPGVVPYMAPRAPTPAAEVVGNSFVNQFYTILHTSPAVLYRFYTNDSTLIVSGEHGAASDAPTTYRTQRDIHNKVVSMRYDETQADVKSIDASHTLGGGVLVQVTGALRRKGDDFARNFVQSFLLAPQENGFFVLNDIVRYLDKVDTSGEKAPKEAKTSAKQQDVKGESKTKAAEVKSTKKESGDNKAKDDSKSTEDEDAGEVDPSKPRTYAMMAASAAAAAAAAKPTAATAKPTAATAATISPMTSPSATSPSSKSPDKAEQTVAATKPGCGIFIKNIFIESTVEDLEREFSKFGVVLGGAKGINLKAPKLSHETKFAFIDFDEPASAQAALEATIELHGKILVVEMKKASVVNAKGVGANGKKESKGREGGVERKGSAKNGRQPKKTEGAGSNK